MYYLIFIICSLFNTDRPNFCNIYILLCFQLLSRLLNFILKTGVVIAEVERERSIVGVATAVAESTRRILDAVMARDTEAVLTLSCSQCRGANGK
jgi:hypothetical protein